MALRRFALVYAIVFLVVGAAGFMPAMTTEHTHPDVHMTTGLALELGLFPINVLHNIVHLAFGVWGLVAARTVRAASLYAKAVAIIYAVLTVMGFVPAANLHTTFGLIPLYGHDIWLHAGLAIVAAYFGFARHDADKVAVAA